MSIHNLQYFKDDFWNKQREEFLSKEDAVNGIILGQDWNLVGNTTANNSISLPSLDTFDEIYVEMFHSEGTIMHQEEFKKESLLFESTNTTHREILLDSIGDTNTYVTYDIENNTITASSIEGIVVDENSTNVFMGIYIKKTETSDASIPSKRVIHDDTTSQLGVNNIKDAIDKIVENIGNINNDLDNVVSTANSYTDTKVADLVGSAPETLDTLQEVAQAIEENEDVVTALNSAIGSKANQSDLTSLTTRVTNVETTLGFELTSTLATGQTSLVFTDSRITTNSVLDSVYTSIFGVAVKSAVFEDGSLTLIFPAQTVAMSVKVVIK